MFACSLQSWSQHHVTCKPSFKWICEDIIKLISASRIFEFPLKHYNWNLPTLHSRNKPAGGRAPASISQKNCPPQNHTDHKNALTEFHSHSALHNWADLQKLFADTCCASMLNWPCSTAEQVPAGGAADCSTAALHTACRTFLSHWEYSWKSVIGQIYYPGLQQGQQAQTLH